MELNLKGRDLFALLRSVVEYEQDRKYEIIYRERERIAREMKERNIITDDIAEMTKLELTEVEALKVNHLKEMIHYELREVDRKKESSNNQL